MTDVQIKHLTDQEKIFDIFHWFPSYAFGPTPPLPNKEEKIEQIKERPDVLYYVLTENGKTAATAASNPMTQNVRGKIYPMGGLYDIITHPEYRRKGYCNKVVRALLNADRNNGKIFSTLYPFRESFYEKMGYITYQEPLKIKFKTATLAPITKKNISGEVEMINIADNFQIYLDYVKVIQTDRHGMGFFDSHPTIGIKKRPSWLVIARNNDEIVGMMVYKLVGEEVTKLTLRATRFLYTKPEGRYLLLEWISRHIDQASEAEIWLPSYEQPNTWLSDLSVEISKVWLAPMGRVLDLPKISGMKVGAGEFTAVITDPFCSWNEGVWKFENNGGELLVSQADTPDCELSIQGLSALIYGTHDPEIFNIMGWGNPSLKIQEKMLKLFPPKTPYLYEYF